MSVFFAFTSFFVAFGQQLCEGHPFLGQHKSLHRNKKNPTFVLLRFAQRGNYLGYWPFSRGRDDYGEGLFGSGVYVKKVNLGGHFE
jgi:hypothetical protein